MRGYIAAIACIGVSSVLAQGHVEFLGVSPAIQTAHALEKRQDEDCAMSVLETDLAAPTPTNEDFLEWLTEAPSNQGCEPTVPASWSDEFLEYYEVLVTYMETVGSVAAEVTTDCGFDEFFLTLSTAVSCSSSVTVHFSGAGDDEDSSTVLAIPAVETDVIDIGEGDSAGASYIASRKMAVLGAATTLMAFFGVHLL